MVPSELTKLHDAVTLPDSVITLSESARIGIVGALERSIDTIALYAPNVWLSPTPDASLTLTYHVLPVSSPLMFHALTCVLGIM